MKKDNQPSSQRLVVSRAESGQSVAAVLHHRLGLSWGAARRLVDERRVRLGKELCKDAGRRLKPGQWLEVRPESKQQTSRSPQSHKQHDAAPRYQGPAPIIRHVDADVVVVDKPAGLTTVRHPDEAAEFGARAQRFLPPTLADLLPEKLPHDHSKKPSPLRAVHRLDKDTSGLVVFARTAKAENHLNKQFRAHSIGRRYLAIVRGRAQSERIESNLVRDRGDGRRGSADDGKHAVTHVKVLEELGGFTLVECRLETGRTHQVRIHLGERGTPICGEHLYDRPLHGAPLPDTSKAERLALHAADLEFDHPTTGRRLTFHSPLPKDLAELLKRLRR